MHGIKGLRVADASVMPRPPSGNTHATCIMIGERAAAFMIEEFSAMRAYDHDARTARTAR